MIAIMEKKKTNLIYEIKINIKNELISFKKNLK